MKFIWLAGLVFCLFSIPNSSLEAYQNISFPRIGDANGDGITDGGVLGSAGVATDAIYLPQMDPDSDSVNSGGITHMFLPGLLAESSTDGSHAKAISMPFFGEILSPPEVALFIPDHEFSGSHHGTCTVSQAGAIATTWIRTSGFLEVAYATQPGSMVTPSPTNQFATLSKFMWFLAVGPTDYLGVSDSSLDFLSPLGQFGSGEGFRHRIVVGDSDLTLVHLGNGVFNTFGDVAASSELSSNNWTNDFFRVDFGSVNHLITANQRVRIDSENDTGPRQEIFVQLLQRTTTSAGRGPVALAGGPTDFMIGTDNWIWTFNTSAWFFGEDLVVPDTPGGGGTGGGGTGGGGTGGGPGGGTGGGPG